MEQSRAIGVGDAQSVAATRSGKGEALLPRWTQTEVNSKFGQ